MNIRKDIGITFDDVLLIPQKTPVASRSHVDLTTQLTKKIKLSSPIISANMDTVTEATMATALARIGGIGIIHRFMNIKDQAAEVKKVKKQDLLVGAAIGIKDDYLDRTKELVNNGVDILVLDIAHGHSIHLLKAMREIKKKFPSTPIIAGNVATYEGARDLINNGADCIKVGIGPGSICITRLVAGSGVPQITAISEVVRAARRKDIPVIADGGIRTSGDIVKALAAGASTVMIGSMFAGCDESPSEIVEKDGKKYKITRGMASVEAYKKRYAQSKRSKAVEKDLKNYAAEGVEAKVKYKGPVKEMILKLQAGIKSGFSYCGAENMGDLWQNAEFIRISTSALIESRPHDVTI